MISGRGGIFYVFVNVIAAEASTLYTLMNVALKPVPHDALVTLVKGKEFMEVFLVRSGQEPLFWLRVLRMERSLQRCFGKEPVTPQFLISGANNSFVPYSIVKAFWF